MFRLTRTHVHPIGLDVGHDSVRMLQLEQTGDRLSVLAAAKASVAAEAKSDPKQRSSAVIEVIRKMLRKYPFRGRSVVASLPREFLHLRTVRVPLGSTDLAGAALREASGTFPFATCEGVIEHLDAGEIRQADEWRQEVLLLGTRDAEVAQHLKMLRTAGVRVVSLDAEPCALYRTVEKFMVGPPVDDQVDAIIDIGLNGSLLVIGRGSQIHFIRSIEIGGRRIHEAVSRKLGITVDEAQALCRRLSDKQVRDDEHAAVDRVRHAAGDAARGVMELLGREITLSLRYFAVTFRGCRPSRLFVAGGQASDMHLRATLADGISLPVVPCDQLRAVDISWMRGLDSSDAFAGWSLAFGLALKAVKAPIATHSDASSPASPMDAERNSAPAAASDVSQAASFEPAPESEFAWRVNPPVEGESGHPNDDRGRVPGEQTINSSADTFYKTDPVTCEDATEAARRMDLCSRDQLTAAGTGVTDARS